MKFVSNLENVINEIKRCGKIPVFIETTEDSGNGQETFLTVRNGNQFGYKCILINPALLIISLPPLNVNDYTTGNMPAILTKQELMSSKYYPLNVSISDVGNLSLTHRNDDFVERYIGLYCSPFLYRACCYTPCDEKDGKFVPAHRDEIFGNRNRSNLLGETGREIEIQMSMIGVYILTNVTILSLVISIL